MQGKESETARDETLFGPADLTHKSEPDAAGLGRSIEEQESSVAGLQVPVTPEGVCEMLRGVARQCPGRPRCRPTRVRRARSPGADLLGASRSITTSGAPLLEGLLHERMPIVLNS